jgi:hypothetical protein
MYYVEEQPDLVRRMIDEGHIVGNHSNNHPVMPKRTVEKMIYEVMSLHDYVKEHFGYEMFLFRHPTGEFSVQSLAVVQNLGYKNVHWSFAHVDYDPENQPDIDSTLANVTGSAHNGAIYLLHATQTQRATQEAEVAFNIVETLVVGGIGQRVAVLIEGEESSPLAQLREYVARVTSTTECKVAIGAVGADIHQIYRLLQQYGHVVCCSV